MGGTDERETCRNGFRDRQFNTRLGGAGPSDPEAARVTYFLPFLEASGLSEHSTL